MNLDSRERIRKGKTDQRDTKMHGEFAEKQNFTT